MIGVFDGLESVTSGSFLPFIIFGVMTSSRDDNVCAAALTALAHYMFADNARPKSGAQTFAPIEQNPTFVSICCVIPS